MFLKNTDLFGDRVISTVSFNEQELIRDILELHANGNYIDCDPTFSIGNFYKDGLRKPKYVFDKTPQIEGVVEATSDSLPIDNESVNTLMFDPPFVMGVSEKSDEEYGGIIGSRFTSFKNFAELKKMYSESLKGILSGTKNRWNSNFQMSGLYNKRQAALYPLLGYV